MRPRSNRTTIAFTFLALAGSASAQEPGPREQFQAAVAAYQKEKGSTQENALKVIALFKQLDPPPAVPEEARKPFIMGATILKKARTPADAGAAAELFTKALHIAPWFAEAWYNRALARETEGQFVQAMNGLTVYLEFTLSDGERREAKDKIYALEAEAQLASTKAAEAAAKEKSWDSVAGEWHPIDYPRLKNPETPWARWRLLAHADGTISLFTDKIGETWTCTEESSPEKLKGKPDDAGGLRCTYYNKGNKGWPELRAEAVVKVLEKGTVLEIQRPFQMPADNNPNGELALYRRQGYTIRPLTPGFVTVEGSKLYLGRAK